MEENNGQIPRFWRRLKEAESDQSRMEFGFETRLFARLRENRGSSGSLLQLAGNLAPVFGLAAVLFAAVLPFQWHSLQALSESTASVGDGNELASLAGEDGL